MKLTRRSMIAAAAAAPLALAAKKVTVGLELYSVRDDLKKDLFGTVKAVAKMGYEGVEFYSPYYSWTPEYTKEVRALLDDLKIKCLSTHNGSNAFDEANYAKTVDLNGILGSRFVVMASAGRVKTVDDWKGVAEKLTKAQEKFGAAKLRTGFHNHQLEFTPIEGAAEKIMPMEILANNTPKNVVLQLDVGTCVHAGYDPAAWIEKNPGRIASIHCKDWSSDPAKGYKVAFGEGQSPWKAIFAAAEKVGGVEDYLIEQESSEVPLEMVARCLSEYKKMHA